MAPRTEAPKLEIPWDGIRVFLGLMAACAILHGTAQQAHNPIVLMFELLTLVCGILVLGISGGLALLQHTEAYVAYHLESSDDRSP